MLLSTREMRRHSFNQLLVALATFDILFIVVSVPVYTYGMFDFMVGNQVSEKKRELDKDTRRSRVIADRCLACPRNEGK